MSLLRVARNRDGLNEYPSIQVSKRLLAARQPIGTEPVVAEPVEVQDPVLAAPVEVRDEVAAVGVAQERPGQNSILLPQLHGEVHLALQDALGVAEPQVATER